MLTRGLAPAEAAIVDLKCVCVFNDFLLFLILALLRIPPLPPASLDCRERPLPLTPNYAKCARISQHFVHKPDLRERTA